MKLLSIIFGLQYGQSVECKENIYGEKGFFIVQFTKRIVNGWNGFEFPNFYRFASNGKFRDFY